MTVGSFVWSLKPTDAVTIRPANRAGKAEKQARRGERERSRGASQSARLDLSLMSGVASRDPSSSLDRFFTVLFAPLLCLSCLCLYHALVNVCKYSVGIMLMLGFSMNFEL